MIREIATTFSDISFQSFIQLIVLCLKHSELSLFAKVVYVFVHFTSLQSTLIFVAMNPTKGRLMNPFAR